MAYNINVLESTEYFENERLLKMTEYKGYKIRNCGEYYEILNKDDKYLRNAMTASIAKEYIDLIER